MSFSMNDVKGYRGQLLHFTGEPKPTDKRSPTNKKDGDDHYVYHEDGVLLVSGSGHVVAADSAEALAAEGLDLTRCEHFPGHLIMPGMVDTHIHYPQTGVIASYGEQLIDWLNQYTFPEEQRFADLEFAASQAEQFLNLLMDHGTTTAMVYTTVHPQSTEAFFSAAQQRGARMIAGKVMMDRNAPPAFLDTPKSSELDCRQLIERWHGTDRLHYALTPRFAPTSTAEQLAVAGTLLREYEGLYLQTHISENKAEMAWVAELFPDARDYLDVYDRYGLLNERSVLGHGIYLNDRERQRLAETGARVAFCPTSNLFLGSGLLDRRALADAGVDVCLATDVGGGTSFSMLRTLSEAYKVMQLQHQSLHPLEALYWVTLGNARSLGLDHRIGNFAKGKEADFIVLDLNADALQGYRQSRAVTLSEKLFALMTLGDRHNVVQTYLMGHRQAGYQTVKGDAR